MKLQVGSKEFKIIDKSEDFGDTITRLSERCDESDFVLEDSFKHLPDAVITESVYYDERNGKPWGPQSDFEAGFQFYNKLLDMSSKTTKKVQVFRIEEGDDASRTYHYFASTLPSEDVIKNVEDAVVKCLANNGIAVGSATQNALQGTPEIG